MKIGSLFGLVTAGALLSPAPVAAQCQMIYNLSVYSDAWVSEDLSTVYAHTNAADNSTKCNCSHSNYQSMALINGPNGSEVRSTHWGMESSVSMATNGLMGTYQSVGTETLQCSCFGQVGAGGPGQAVTVSPTVAITGGNNYVLWGSDSAVLANNLVQAAGRPTGGQYSWSVNNPNRLSITNTAQPGVAQLQAINPSSSPNDTVLTVNYNYNGSAAAPATKTTTVTIYRYLTQNGSYNPISYPPPLHGYDGYVYYSIFAQPGRVRVEYVSGLYTYEQITQVSLLLSDFAGTVVLRTASGATDPNGQIVDELGVQCSCTIPSNLQIVDTQDIFVENIFVRNNILTYSNSTATIANSGPYN